MIDNQGRGKGFLRGLLVDKTRVVMRPHPILTVNADQDEIA